MSGIAPACGQELTPKLRLLRPLGRGGMGVLWVAEHRSLRSEVVVKFLLEDAAASPGAGRRIAREAASAARVKSHHVVQIFDHGVTEAGVPYIVMELLDGCDLRTHLLRRGILSPEETTGIVHQIALALAKTHAAGLVHRDVKLSNVFLCDEHGEVFVKLLDFGLAKRWGPTDESMTESGRWAGTPTSMSPEQILGGAVDARSDVWSLGVLAFQCLTGKRPFEGETLGAIALAVHTLPLPRITAFQPQLRSEVDGWFATACSRPVERRFAGALEAAQELARALAVDISGSGRAPLGAGRGQAPDATFTAEFTVGRRERNSASRWTEVWRLRWVAAGLALASAATAFFASYTRGDAGPIAHPRGREALEITATRDNEAGRLAATASPDRDSPRPSVPTTGSPAKLAASPRVVASGPPESLSAVRAPEPIVRTARGLYELPDERR